jgi:hypothetical protein
MARMGHDSERAALIYQYEARGAGHRARRCSGQHEQQPGRRHGSLDEFSECVIFTA